MNRSRLERLGLYIEYATDEQIEAIDSLSDSEIDLLVKIKERLDETSGDVEGHTLEGGGVVW